MRSAATFSSPRTRSRTRAQSREEPTASAERVATPPTRWQESEAVPDERKCSICLGELSDASQPDGCAHRFCFVCLLEWSKMSLFCPLCKTEFSVIRHKYDDGGSYVTYVFFSFGNFPSYHTPYCSYEPSRPMSAAEARRRLYESMPIEQQELQRTVRSLAIALTRLAEDSRNNTERPVDGRRSLGGQTIDLVEGSNDNGFVVVDDADATPSDDTTPSTSGSQQSTSNSAVNHTPVPLQRLIDDFDINAIEEAREFFMSNQADSRDNRVNDYARNLRSFRRSVEIDEISLNRFPCRYNALLNEANTLTRAQFLMHSIFRRLIYERQLYALPLTDEEADHRMRPITAAHYQHNQDAITRLVPFIRRDLNVLYSGDRRFIDTTTEVLIELIKTYGLETRHHGDIKWGLLTSNLVRPLHVDQLLHELRQFASTPYSDEAYFSYVDFVVFYCSNT